jgi:ribosomal protein S18 acetylase RimI-like enzyme
VNDVMTDLSQPNLVVAIKANLCALFRQLSCLSQAEPLPSAKLIRWHTRVPHPWFNGVLSTQPPGDDADEAIEEALSYFQSRHVATFTWWLEPHVPTAEWARLFLPKGFQYNDRVPGMAVDLAAVPTAGPSSMLHPEGLTIQHVRDLEALRVWTRTFVAGYELPEPVIPPFFELMASLGLELPLRNYLGFLEGEPVATATLFLGAGVAGIYDVATLPQARGQGIGTALTLAPLREARQMGYRAAVLQSSPQGMGVYQRLGFRQLCTVDHFYWRSPQD